MVKQTTDIEDNTVEDMIRSMLDIIEGGDAKIDFAHSQRHFYMIEDISDFLGMKLNRLKKLNNPMQEIVDWRDAKKVKIIKGE
tara:strand:+ start:1511 stop:1759 length:249 start_codon:yes stop_codon:yes gene_type:complete